VDHVTAASGQRDDRHAVDIPTYPAHHGVAPEARFHKAFRWRGGVGVLLLVPVSIASVFSAPLVSQSSWIHLALQSLAWCAFLAGAGLRFWSTLYIGGRKERALVTDGPYSLCRHPLYLGSLLIGVSAGLFLESPVFELALAVAALTYVSTTIPIEEGVLRSRHESEYAAFSARTPRLWPSWRHFHSPARLPVDVHALELEFSRALRWVWIPIAGEVLTALRYQPWWPHLFRAF